MGLTTLFTHLKIISFQCFQFQFSVSVFSFSKNKLNPNGPIVLELPSLSLMCIFVSQKKIYKLNYKVYVCICFSKKKSYKLNHKVLKSNKLNL